MQLPFALVAGLFVAIGAGRVKQLGSISLGAVIGAVLAAVSYALIAGIVLQNENSDAVLPPGTNCRLLLFFLIPFSIWSTILYQLKATHSVEVASSGKVPVSI